MIRICVHVAEGSGKGVRVTEGKLRHRVLQSYTGKSLTAINVLAVLVRVGNQLSRSLPQFMVEYIETRQISFNLHSPSHLKLFSTNRKKNHDLIIYISEISFDFNRILIESSFHLFNISIAFQNRFHNMHFVTITKNINRNNLDLILYI